MFHVKHFSAPVGKAIKNAEISAKIDKYVRNLLEWNAHFNLFSFEEGKIFEEVVEKSLFFVEEIVASAKVPTVCDIGSGAGIPGIVIQIVLPLAKVDLLESSGKKAGFLRQMKNILNLDNLGIVNENAREFARKAGKLYNFVVGRAFGERFYDYASKLVKKGGKILYFKESLSKMPFKVKPDGVKNCEKGFLLIWNG